MQSIRHWLSTLGLTQYAESFEENQISVEILSTLTDQDLRDLGVSALGHRKIILKAIADENSRSDERQTAQATTTSQSPSTLGERRQLTVLFCDMVGYTELTGRVDPEVVQGIVRSYEDTCAVSITRYEGYVYQRLGDGIVAFFGYPLAHEGEAERAIHAGLSIIEALNGLEVPEAGRLRVRIGIATGLVVVSGVEKGAVGETMNLAARLQAIASEGTVVVSERVRQLARGRFDYEDLGEQRLKGIAQATRAFRVQGVSAATSRFEAATQEGLTPLVGREQELGLLLERWGQAREGEGQAVLLSGEPGIGKSRMLSALRERLEGKEGAHSLRFQCSPYHVNSAFYPSIENLERGLKFGKEEAPESKLDKLEAMMVGHYGRPLTDVRFIAAMLSIPVEGRYGALQMTPQRFKDETLRSLVDLVAAGARQAPSMLLFEDAHWADPTTLEVLDLLMDRTRALPLLIVLTHRPEFQNRWGSHGHVTSLNLSKLTRAQSAAMVHRVAKGKALPGNLQEQILAKTDGIPLFVEELTKAVLESKEMVEGKRSYEYKGNIAALTIPATLRDSLMARLDRNAAVKEVAQVGAVIGREFSYELVAAVLQRSQDDLDRALNQLTDSGLAFRRGTPPEASYLFKHALVQDAAYDSLLKTRRQDLHARIAKAIEEKLPQVKETEPEIVAHHLTEAGQIDAAVPLWQKAAELRLARMALNEALSFATRSLALLENLPASNSRDSKELDVRVVQGTVNMALKGWPAPDVWVSFRPALELATALGRTDLLLPILWGLYVHVLTAGRVAESATWSQRLSEIAETTGRTDLRVASHVTALGTEYWLGNFEKARWHVEQIHALYDAKSHRHLVDLMNHDPKTYAGAVGSQCIWMLGYPDQAAKLSDQKDEHSKGLRHPFDHAWSHTFGSDVWELRRDHKHHLEIVEEAARVASENSLLFFTYCLVPIRRGMTAFREGRGEEGIPLMQAGLDVWHQVGGRVDGPKLDAILAEALGAAGRIDEAMQVIDGALEQIRRPGWEERSHHAEVLRVKGCIHSMNMDIGAAEAAFIESLEVARSQHAKSWELRAAMSLARLWQSQGKRKQAYDLIAPLYAWFTEGFDTGDLKEAKALLHELR